MALLMSGKPQPDEKIDIDGVIVILIKLWFYRAEIACASPFSQKKPPGQQSAERAASFVDNGCHDAGQF